MADGHLERAREVVTQLFKLLNVTRVVCIDDAYAPSLVYLKELIAELGPEIVRQVPRLAAIPWEQEDVAAVQLGKLWNELSPADHADLHRQLLSVGSAGVANLEAGNVRDLVAAGTLADIVQGHEFLAISPSEWKARQAEILGAAREGRTVFLFDLELSHDQGAAANGIRLLQDFLALGHSEPPLCGLLSHTFGVNDEEARSADISSEHGVEPGTFAPIAKERLHVDPLDFARSLKITVINPSCEDLKRRAGEIVGAACAEAAQALGQLTVYEFERIVFQASLREGIWEPDTLFRLYGLFQRRAARQLAKKDDQLRSLASAIRRVAEIPTESPLAPEHTAWKIQRLELYEDPDYLNRYHLPIELGDLFETVPVGTAAPRRFILLSQPCDLMVRSDGARSPDIHDGTLVEIRGDPPRDPDAGAKLLYFDEDDGSPRFVWFRRKFSVRLCVLDLCAFDDDGVARLVLANECPADVLPAWQRRHYELRRVAARLISETRELKKKNIVPQKILDLLIPSPSHKATFKGSVNVENETVEYNCRRIGRLCEGRAVALLARLHSFDTRPAFELDFGTDPRPAEANASD